MNKLITALPLLLLLTGCSVKQDDTTAEKIAKHTINAPLYLVVGVGGVATKATHLAGGLVATPFVLMAEQLDSNSTDSNSTKIIEILEVEDETNTTN